MTSPAADRGQPSRGSKRKGVRRPDISPEVVREAFLAGATLREIAEKFSCSEDIVFRRLHAGGRRYRRSGRSRRRDVTLDAIRALMDKGKTPAQVASALRCSKQTVVARLREARVLPPPVPWRCRSRKTTIPRPNFNVQSAIDELIAQVNASRFLRSWRDETLRRKAAERPAGPPRSTRTERRRQRAIFRRLEALYARCGYERNVAAHSHHGPEVRFDAKDETERDEIEVLLLQAGIECGRPYRHRTHWRIPVYGREAVDRLLNSFGSTEAQLDLMVEVSGRRGW